MNGTRRRFVGALLGAQALAAIAAHAQSSGPAVGSRLALVDLPLLEGGWFRAAQADRQVVVVYWWASWCPFCAEMTPSIEKLWRSQRDRGLAVLGISIDKNGAAPTEYRRRHGYTFPSTLYSPSVERVLPYPGTVPVLWVSDRSGRVVVAEKGQLFPEDVEQISRFL
jgi:thiol-disulfide isomerase/thioredoxin